MANAQVLPRGGEGSIFDFFELVVKDCQEAGLSPREAHFTFNGRLQRSLGRCSKEGVLSGKQQRFLIELNYCLAQTQNVALIRDVVAHELIHTIPGCNNHGPAFQEAAQKLNDYFPGVYNVQIQTNLADYGLEPPKANHYEIVCQDCEHTMYRQRMSKSLRQINRYRCPKCHGPLKVYRVRYVYE